MTTGARTLAINPREVELDQLHAGDAYPNVLRRIGEVGAVHNIHTGGNAS